MTILMFGWEFPPHISGGLGTACYGLTKSLIEENTAIRFVVPRAYGDESFDIINASDVAKSLFTSTHKSTKSIIANKEESSVVAIESSLSPYGKATEWATERSVEKWNYELKNKYEDVVKRKDEKQFQFSGGYGPTLFEEVQRYGEVAALIAQQQSFDIIHAHDWITYPAGIAAKTVSGKPLVVHVHATEIDRAGLHHIDTRVSDIERSGLQHADRVITVSQWTRDMVISHYGIDADKIEVVHNGIERNDEEYLQYFKFTDHIVTFLGRITHQKGPGYFVEAARKVLDHIPDVHFVMAGSGDLLPQMIERTAQLKMSSRVHFTGFLRKPQMNQLWSVSDLYVMPSVSEPFGITPLEAIQAGVPVIVSNQSGVSEVLQHAIKTDFWDIDALSDAIINVLKHKALSRALKANGKKEIDKLSWHRAAKKINVMYQQLQHAIN